MKKSNLILFTSMITSLNSVALTADGVIPPAPNDLAYTELNRIMEAVGGFGKTQNLYDELAPTTQEHNTICGGLLVAENIILTARHCLTDPRFLDHWGDVLSAVNPDGSINTSAPEMWFDTDPASPIPQYTVRFRLLNSQGDVGSFQGGHESFYQAPVKRIVFPARNPDIVGPSVDEDEAELDMVLLILADGPNDNQTNGLWQNGFITHIDSVELVLHNKWSAIPSAASTGAYGPLSAGTATPPDNGQRGILRVFESDNVIFHDTNGSGITKPINMIINGGPGISGGVTFFPTEIGQFIPGWGLQGGGGVAAIGSLQGSLTWDIFFPSTPHPFGSPLLSITSDFDVTGSPSFVSPIYTAGYNTPNWTINTEDAIAMAALNPGLVSADWDQNGSVDQADFQMYTDQISGALNPYAANPLLPLPVRLADINNDHRLNKADLSALQALYGQTEPEYLIFDFSSNGVIDSQDALILQRVLNATPTGSSIKVFNHGVFGDYNLDGVLDCTDLVGYPTFAFDGTERADIPGSGYMVELDYNINQMLDGQDRRKLASRLLPGDVATGIVYQGTDDALLRFGEAPAPFPDFLMTTYDARRFLISTFNRNPSSIGVTGLDLVGDGWQPGDPITPPDGLINTADKLFALSSWTMSCDPVFQTDSLLDLWFVDNNTDGRFNILDAQWVQDLFNNNPGVYFEEWDLDSNGISDTADLNFIFKTAQISSTYGQGFLGDIDSSGSPFCIDDCTNPNRPGFSIFACENLASNTCGLLPISTVASCLDLTLIVNQLPDLFDSGLLFGEPGYIVQLDADLDGDLDFFDQIAVLQHIQPADLAAPWGTLDFFDISAFLTLYNSGDLEADIAAPFGSLDFFDISAFMTWFNSGCP